MFAIFRKIINGVILDKYFTLQKSAIIAIDDEFRNILNEHQYAEYDLTTTYNSVKGFTKYMYSIDINKNDTIILELIEGEFQE